MLAAVATCSLLAISHSVSAQLDVGTDSYLDGWYSWNDIGSEDETRWQTFAQTFSVEAGPYLVLSDFTYWVGTYDRYPGGKWDLQYRAYLYGWEEPDGNPEAAIGELGYLTEELWRSEALSSTGTRGDLDDVRRETLEIDLRLKPNQMYAFVLSVDGLGGSGSLPIHRTRSIDYYSSGDLYYAEGFERSLFEERATRSLVLRRLLVPGGRLRS